MGEAKVRFFSLLLYLCISQCLGGIHPDGVSEVSRLQDDQGNYQFSYKVSDVEGEQFRKEGTDANGAVVGSYGFTEVDGRQRVVDYIADAYGFRAHVRTNEPGTADSNPAGVTVVKENHPGSHTQLDFAATSVSSSSTRNPRKEYPENPEKVFGLRLTPVSSQNRNPDLDTSYVRKSPTDYPLEDISSISDHRQARPYTPTNSRDPGVYYPPLNPVASTADFPEYQTSRIPAHSSSSLPPASLPDSSRPYVPPYGGGYETFYGDVYANRNDVNRRPDSPPTAVHDGYIRDPYIIPPPQQRHEVTRIRSSSPRRPDHYPPVPDDRILIATRDDIPIQSPNRNSPNLVLRAVPIPNGIQAVHVNPSTGEIHRNVVYPAFDRQGGGFSLYDRDARMFNRFPDMDYVNYGNGGLTGYEPSAHHNTDHRYVSGTRRRYPSGTPYDVERPLYAGEGIVRNRQPVTTPEDLSLTTPLARDLAALPPHLRHGYNADPRDYGRDGNIRSYSGFPRHTSALDNRYPANQVVPEIYHPGYATHSDYDESPNGFNPYFGALPSSPVINTYPNYQRSAVFDSDSAKTGENGNSSKKKSSVEFVHDDPKTGDPSSEKLH